jgi:hypothetical protein
MDFDGSALEHMPRDECMRLMASVPVGRVVYTRQALPPTFRRCELGLVHGSVG